MTLRNWGTEYKLAETNEEKLAIAEEFIKSNDYTYYVNKTYKEGLISKITSKENFSIDEFEAIQNILEDNVKKTINIVRIETGSIFTSYLESIGLEEKTREYLELLYYGENNPQLMEEYKTKYDLKYPSIEDDILEDND